MHLKFRSPIRTVLALVFSFFFASSVFASGAVKSEEKIDPFVFVEVGNAINPTPTVFSFLEKAPKTIIQWITPLAPPVSTLLNPAVNSEEGKKEERAEKAANVFMDFTFLPVHQQALTKHLNANYKVSHGLAADVVASAYQAGKKYDLDPLLILAIIKVESMFKPNAVSPMNAKGLMQVLPRAHPEKIAEVGGIQQLFTPNINIKMGAQILREFLGRAIGSLTHALLRYNGSLKDPRQSYAKKVLAAREEFQKVQVAERVLDLK